VKLYGIKNCDTVKKARQWLSAHNIECEFHDFRSDGIALDMVERWLDAVGSDKLLNKRSTTWKSLDCNIRDNLVEQDIPALLVANPTLIKRPVLERDADVLVGFSDKVYNEHFGL